MHLCLSCQKPEVVCRSEHVGAHRRSPAHTLTLHYTSCTCSVLAEAAAFSGVFMMPSINAVRAEQEREADRWACRHNGVSWCPVLPSLCFS